MASERTIKCKHLKNLFFILSCLCWIGVALTVAIICLSRVGNDGSVMDLLSDDAKEKFIAFGTTALIGILLALFIKEKIRTALYMISLIMIVILKGEAGMYAILGVWALDEYVFTPLHRRYKNKYTINKEIDMR